MKNRYLNKIVRYVIFSFFITGLISLQAAATPIVSLVSTTTIDSGNDDYGLNIATDSVGNIWAVGETFNGTNKDFVLWKFTPSGEFSSSTTLDSGYDDTGWGIAVDNTNTVWATGETWNGSNSDFVLWEFNSGGNFQSSTTLNGGSHDKGHSIAIGGGFIWVVGASTNTTSDFALWKFSSAGTYLSSTTLNSGDDDLGWGIDIDSQGNIWAVGRSGSSDSQDFRLWKFTSGGAVTSTTTIDGGFRDQGIGIAIDASDNIWAVGETGEGLSPGSYFALWKISNAGSVLSTTTIYNGSGTGGWGPDVSIDNSGNIFAIGNPHNGSNRDLSLWKFDNSGSVLSTTTINSGWNDWGERMVISDNDIWVVGESWDGATDNFKLWRFAELPATELSPYFTNVTTGSFTINWEWHSGASYDAVLALDEEFSLIIASGLVTTSTTKYHNLDVGIAPDTRYYFKVKLSTESEAAYTSPPVSSMTLPATDLSPYFTDTTTGSFVVTWTDYSGAEDYYFASLARDANFSSIITSGSVTGNTTSYNNIEHSIIPGTSYYFKVKISTESDGAYTDPAISTRTIYKTDLNPMIVNVTTGSFTVNWDWIGPGNYDVALALDEGFSTIIATGSISGFNTTKYHNLDVGIAPDTRYYFKVKLSSESDAGYTSPPISSITLPATDLSPYFTDVTTGSFVARWTDYSGAGDYYLAALATDEAFSSIIASGPVTGNTTNYDYLTDGISFFTTYYFRVKISSESDAAYTDPFISTRTLELTTELSPVFVNVTTGSFNVSWNDYSQSSQYFAVLATDEDFTTIITSRALTGAATTYENLTSGIAPSTTYYFKVKISTEGDSAYTSPAISTQTSDFGTALNPVVVDVTTGSFTINWEDNSDTSQYFASLALDQNFSSIITSGPVTSNTTSFNDLDDNIQPDTAYYFKVKISSEGDSAYTSPIISTTTLPWLTELNPYFVNVTYSSIEIAWDNISANYIAVLSTDNAFSITTASGAESSNSRVYSNLNANTTHYFKVKVSTEMDAAYTSPALSTSTLIETPTSIYIDELSTTTITVSAYASTFTNLSAAGSGINIASTTEYAGWSVTADSWTTKADMPTVRYIVVSAVVGGKIYAIGGNNGKDQNEEYDPAANTWTTRQSMPTGRSELTGAVVGDKIYVIGGINGDLLNVNEEYNPVTNTWITKAPMPTPRSWVASSVVGNKIYVIGGYTGPLNINEGYDPITNTWATKAPMPTARYVLTTSVVGGKIYAIGGNNGTQDQNEEYDPVNNTWATRAPMPTGRAELTSSAVG
ncbi:kelch repeat-containing protein, partial [Elusimicrobiota bacterium]